MRFEPEHFIVEEIIPTGDVLKINEAFTKKDEDDLKPAYYFTQFILQKRLWTTAHAIREVARRLHLSQKRLNYAGNKDRNAVTTQRCSAFAVEPERIMNLRIKDITILGAWKTKEKVALGEVMGNRFTIRVPSKTYDAKTIQEKARAASMTIPNLFGPQRFGSVRNITHEIGKRLVQEKYAEAITHYLTAHDEQEHHAEARHARKRLKETMDYTEALRTFPQHLRIERTLIAHLAKQPNDHLGAFRKLHRSMQLLFVHAYQSHLFNQVTERRKRAGHLLHANIGDAYASLNENGFPNLETMHRIEDAEQREMAQEKVNERKAVLLGRLIGYESDLGEAEQNLLAEEGISLQQFHLRSLPELSPKGGWRPLFLFLNDFQANEENDWSVLRFSLPAGSYATVALHALGIAPE
ncbi:tRNA pseudouridine(13) synthase TruD [Candidatus Micrarchaeota archaeon]|nr:tRNA pseudouridine(13) synthase TruD [Candidatus Micrarchaeota archaeon]